MEHHRHVDTITRKKLGLLVTKFDEPLSQQKCHSSPASILEHRLEFSTILSKTTFYLNTEATSANDITFSHFDPSNRYMHNRGTAIASIMKQ